MVAAPRECTRRPASPQPRRYSSRGTVSMCRIDRPFTMKMTISAMFVA
jgi:hypothetical protein